MIQLLSNDIHEESDMNIDTTLTAIKLRRVKTHRRVKLDIQTNSGISEIDVDLSSDNMTSKSMVISSQINYVNVVF